MEVRVALVSEVIEEHKLSIADGRYMCSCGTPIGTVGSVKDEFTKVTTMYAAHTVHAAISKLRAALE
jgi:hypothetical protein